MLLQCPKKKTVLTQKGFWRIFLGGSDLCSVPGGVGRALLLTGCGDREGHVAPVYAKVVARITFVARRI